MLRLIKIKDPLLRWNLLSELNPETDCFIVSDIKTKLSIESELLKKHGFLPGFCVMRANEFYKELFYSLNSNWNLVSDSFICELFTHFCENHKSPWVKNLKNSKTFLSFFNRVLPMLIHPEHSKLFLEWCYGKQNLGLWKMWFELCQSFFQLLKTKRILNELGVKAILFNSLPSLETLSFHKKRIFVDLAFTFDFCEKDIFHEISKYKEVYILSPELKQDKIFEVKYDVYKKWEEELNADQIDGLNFQMNTKDRKNLSEVNFFKIQSKTQLEEVRKLVLQVCKWIQKGISPKDIVIFAPNIENYWFALKIYFEKEKIPVKKSIVSKLTHFPDIQYFVSALRLHLSYFSFENLEQFCFFKESKKEFSKFKSYYFDVPNREMAKKNLFKGKSRSPQSMMTGRQFIEWALSFWPKEAESFLLDKVSNFFSRFLMEEILEASAWLQFFESEIQSSDIEIEGENQEGVSCLSFNALHSTKSPYIFIIGLDEESFYNVSSEGFNESERESLLNDLGFPLSFSHPKEKEYNLFWFLQSSEKKEVFLSFSNYDFKGNICTPSLLYWLSDSFFSAKQIEIKETLSWDYRKKQKEIHKILDSNFFKEETIKKLKHSFQNKKQNFFHKSELTLSPNRIKLYRECPFKYAAEKIFFVHQEPFVERELSALSKGSIIHKLFENVLNKYPNLHIQPEQLDEMIEEIKPPDEKFVYEKQWFLIKDHLKNILNAFLEKEQKDRQACPQLKLKALEAECSAFWDQDKGELNSKGKYIFKAKIDRIDEDTSSKTYVVRDYKASSSNYKHISAWTTKDDNKEFQLTFYAQAVQKGLVKDLSPGEVSALYYSFYNQDFSAKGFVEKNSPLKALMGSARGHKQEKTALDQAIAESNKETQILVRSMEQGEFSPNPKTKKLCGRCFYQTWCRVETLTEK